MEMVMVMVMVMVMMTTMFQGDRCGGGAQGQQGTPTRRRGYRRLARSSAGDDPLLEFLG